MDTKTALTNIGVLVFQVILLGWLWSEGLYWTSILANMCFMGFWLTSIILRYKKG